MVLLTIASMVIIKSTSAVYFPPHMIIPVMPLKVVGDPYEETSKLPPRLRCPGFRRCEILEEDEERSTYYYFFFHNRAPQTDRVERSPVQIISIRFF